MVIKVAAAQTVVSADISENGKAIRNMIRTAAAEGVRLVLFCEGALSGYCKKQIKSPLDWREFDWDRVEQEICEIAETCRECEIFAVVGSAYPVSRDKHPHNSLVVVSSEGRIAGRYHKRFLSNSEVNGWYTPGTDPFTFEVDGYSFGCAICIEAAFPEVFSGYERTGVDVVLFASFEITPQFKLAIQAHAYQNCIWIVGSPPAQGANNSSAVIIDPNGDVTAKALCEDTNTIAISVLDREDSAFEVALDRARPWRSSARQGDIYSKKIKAISDY
ncbi:MAG: carbon-nitrogen hydrolase family protein [Roseibium sp.]